MASVPTAAAATAKFTTRPPTFPGTDRPIWAWQLAATVAAADADTAALRESHAATISAQEEAMATERSAAAKVRARCLAADDTANAAK